MKGVKKLREFYKKNIAEPEVAYLSDRINEKEYNVAKRTRVSVEKKNWFKEQMKRRPIWDLQVGPNNLNELGQEPGDQPGQGNGKPGWQGKGIMGSHNPVAEAEQTGETGGTGETGE